MNADTHAAANILMKYLKREGILEEWLDHSFEKARLEIVNFPRCVNPQMITQKHKLSFNEVWSTQESSVL